MIVEIPVEKTSIWSPVLTVSNGANKLDSLSLTVADTFVDHTGKITWDFEHVFHTVCDIDVTYFPFDSQTCSLEIFFIE